MIHNIEAIVQLLVALLEMGHLMVTFFASTQTSIADPQDWTCPRMMAFEVPNKHRNEERENISAGFVEFGWGKVEGVEGLRKQLECVGERKRRKEWPKVSSNGLLAINMSLEPLVALVVVGGLHKGPCRRRPHAPLGVLLLLYHLKRHCFG
ncbi:hypothetical protein VNO78_12515 [Psophocarpus tetragonolobus]|uniref:Uncharacterized protein n=1 Tax=Psophocarpus tetragonolobus TaxID=3891 RepID=A0AAN9SVQ1_PSOTE